MRKTKLVSAVGVLLALMMLVGLVPAFGTDANAEYTEYQFLNPLGTIEPRLDTPLADRQSVIDILEGTGPRQLRLGTAWYMKPLDAEPTIAMGRLLKELWEGMYAPGLEVVIVRAGPGAGMSSIPDSRNNIPNVGHPWNSRPDAWYDSIADRVDAVILGVGD